MAFTSLGLCPNAPPKGFPIALWKPSGANPLSFAWIVRILSLTAPCFAFIPVKRSPYSFTTLPAFSISSSSCMYLYTV